MSTKTDNSQRAPGRNRISVAMATYNGAQFIRQQLESIARQTQLPMELVVTDDCSKDDTLAIVEQFARTVPFVVRVYRNESNLGYANNFMRAALLCTGNLIAFCDQDDVWMENKLELCTQAFDDPETLLCVHSGELWDGSSRSGRKCPGYDARRKFGPLDLYPLQSSYGFAMVVRRELFGIADNANRFQKALPPALPMPHDQWSWFLASVFGNIVLLSDVLVLYRQHGGNVFGGKSGGSTVSDALTVRNYEAAALAESRAADFLENLANKCAERWRERSRAGADLMALCSEINTARAKLYGGRLSLAQRLRTYASLFRRTRYAVRQRGARQGLRAAAKDLVFGVTGLQSRGV